MKECHFRTHTNKFSMLMVWGAWASGSFRSSLHPPLTMTFVPRTTAWTSPRTYMLLKCSDWVTLKCLEDKNRMAGSISGPSKNDELILKRFGVNLSSPLKVNYLSEVRNVINGVTPNFLRIFIGGVGFEGAAKYSLEHSVGPTSTFSQPVRSCAVDSIFSKRYVDDRTN